MTQSESVESIALVMLVTLALQAASRCVSFLESTRGRLPLGPEYTAGERVEPPAMRLIYQAGAWPASTEAQLENYKKIQNRFFCSR
jgi:hypothetical protein